MCMKVCGINVWHILVIKTLYYEQLDYLLTFLLKHRKVAHDKICDYVSAVLF